MAVSSGRTTHYCYSVFIRSKIFESEFAVFTS